MLKTPKDLHIQIASAIKATAQIANTRLSILSTKNKQLLPPLVYSYILNTKSNYRQINGKNRENSLSRYLFGVF